MRRYDLEARRTVHTDRRLDGFWNSFLTQPRLVILVILPLTAWSPRASPPAPLPSTEEVAKIRQVVQERPAGVFSGGDLLEQMVDVPQPLRDLYEKKPEAVLKELLILMETSSPWDSSSAGAYGFELLRGPGAGVVC